VVILAGGRCSEEMKALTECDFRADIPLLNGETCLDRTRRVLSKFGEPLVIGGREGCAPRQAPGGESFVESFAAANALVRGRRYLLVTVDLPLLTESAVSDFVSRCDPDIALSYPIVPAAECEAQLPGMKRTTLKLREGHFTGGNIAMIDAPAVQEATAILQRAYAARKSPVALAGIVGLDTLFRVLLSKLVPMTLSVAYLEKRVGKMLTIPVRAVVTHSAEIGADLDSADQYQVFLRALEKREGSEN